MNVKGIVKWTGIGLGIRLLIMPITLHGQDIFFVNYFPMLLVTKGIWDPYGFIKSSIPIFPETYYGPFLLGIMAVVNFVFIKIFCLSSFVRMFEIVSTMMFQNYSTADYVIALSASGFSKAALCTNIFLTKLPYLFFDLGIGFILLKLAPQKSKIATYAVWMLNIVALHSTYAVGQADIVGTFFIAFSLWCAIQKMPFMAMVALGLGGATKLFPLMLIAPTACLLGKNWQCRVRLVLAALGSAAIFYLPFCLSSGTAIFKTFIMGRYYTGPARWILMTLGGFWYLWLTAKAVRNSADEHPERSLVFYFLIAGFLVYSVTPISFRYFLYITPLLALIMPSSRKFGAYVYCVIGMLAFLRITDRSAQLGLFAPINPYYFMSLPTFQDLIGKFFNIDYIYKVVSRLLMVSFLVGAWWLWRMKLNEGRVVNE